MAQAHEIVGDLLENEVVASLVLEFEHILDQVVPEFVLDKIVNICDNLMRNPQLLFSRAFLETPLHHAATVFVGADLNAVVYARLNDKIRVERIAMVEMSVVVLVGQVGSFELRQNALEDVVSVHVIDEPDGVWLEDSDDHLEGLRTLGEPFDDGLHDSGAVDIARYRGRFITNLFNDHSQLLGGCSLDDFLTEVISELVDHGVFDHWEDRFDESRVEEIGFSLWLRDLLLNQSASHLIVAIEPDIVNDLLLIERKPDHPLLIIRFFLPKDSVHHSLSDLVIFLEFRKVRTFSLCFILVGSAQIYLVVVPDRMELVDWRIRGVVPVIHSLNMNF